MQNPFVQLRKYQQGLHDQKENRATETLAACLIFSVEIRREFLNFLFDGKRCFDFTDAQTYVVSTQQQTTDGSWVDLLLEKENEEGIVIEIKVGADEDGSQIAKYVRWLRDVRKMRNQHVFHLVKTHDARFDITKYFGKQYHTWRKLYDYFSIKRVDLETTDANIIEYFCNYVEREGIVSNWKPNQILAYGPGVAANRALNNLFEQVATRLEDLKLDYQTKIMMPENEWPRLEVGRTAWKKIFGEEGYHNKVYVFYMTKGIWDADRDALYFEIKLWDRWHRCDWSWTEAKWQHWIRALDKKNFKNWTQFRGGKELSNISKYTFTEPPFLISAWSPNLSQSEISTDEINKMESEELVERVYTRVREHCDIVSQL